MNKRGRVQPARMEASREVPMLAHEQAQYEERRNGQQRETREYSGVFNRIASAYCSTYGHACGHD